MAISGLPEKTRTAFLLSRIDGKSYAEIAEGFELSIKAVEKHISHAKKISSISASIFSRMLEGNLLSVSE